MNVGVGGDEFIDGIEGLIEDDGRYNKQVWYPVQMRTMLSSSDCVMM